MSVHRLAPFVLAPAILFLTTGCLVTKGTYDAEVARSRGLAHELKDCGKLVRKVEQRNRDLLKTGEKLELERSSLNEERIKLLESLEDVRQGNEEISLELARERRVREEKEKELEAVSSTYTGLVDELQQELEAGQLEIQNVRDGIQVRASQEILFDSGSAVVKAAGKPILAKIARQIVKASDHGVRVEGHSDNMPIATARFPSNWELSGSRAAGVVRFLVSAGVDPTASLRPNLLRKHALPPRTLLGQVQTSRPFYMSTPYHRATRPTTGRRGCVFP